MEKNLLKILLVQHDVVLGDVDANLGNVDNLLASFHQKADIIVLTEMFSTGFAMKPELFAEPADGKAVKWLQTKAKAFNSAIVASVMIDDNGKYYNRAFFVFPDGKYACYNKRHLFSYVSENKKFEAGKSRLVVEYLGWRICPMICYDLRFPVWTRNCNDYDLLIYIASWPKVRQKAWSILTVARALENQSYVAIVNRTGSDKTNSYLGESKIISPLGEILEQSVLNQECLVFGEISLSQLQALRHEFPFLKDADKFCLDI
jgi:predicted amidohydrolase